MANYEFKLDTKQFDNKIKNIINNTPSVVNSALSKLTLIALNYVKKLTPVDTGNLRRNWSFKKGDKQVRIYNNVEYAYFIEKGHRTRSGGFIGGRFMLKRTFDLLEKQAPKIIEDEINRLIK